jgi:hypothetical protein
MRTILEPGTSSGKVDLIPWVFKPEQIEGSWPDMEELVQRSVDESKGTVTTEMLKAMLVAGEATAFATARNGRLVAILIVRVIEYATYKAARVIACAGKDLRGASKFADAFEAWALTNGAVEIEAWCRPVMVKLMRRFGYEEKFSIVARDLRRRLQ